VIRSATDRTSETLGAQGRSSGARAGEAVRPAGRLPGGRRHPQLLARPEAALAQPRVPRVQARGRNAEVMRDAEQVVAAPDRVNEAAGGVRTGAQELVSIG